MLNSLLWTISTKYKRKLSLNSDGRHTILQTINILMANLLPEYSNLIFKKVCPQSLRAWGCGSHSQLACFKIESKPLLLSYHILHNVFEQHFLCRKAWLKNSKSSWLQIIHLLFCLDHFSGFPYFLNVFSFHNLLLKKS